MYLWFCFSEHDSACHSLRVSSFCFSRCATLSWCGRRSVSWRAVARGAAGAGLAACQRVVWALATGRGGQATPFLTRKDLVSWSPQGRTWDSPLWPWAPSPPSTAPAGSTRCAERNPLRPAPLPTVAQLPVASLCPFPLSQTPPLSWEAHKIHQSRRKQRLSRMCRWRSPHPWEPAKPRLSQSAKPWLPQRRGATPLGAGRARWCLCRWAKALSHPNSNSSITHFMFIQNRKLCSVGRAGLLHPAARACPLFPWKPARRDDNKKKNQRGIISLLSKLCVQPAGCTKRRHNLKTYDAEEWHVLKTKTCSHDSWKQAFMNDRFRCLLCYDL